MQNYHFIVPTGTKMGRMHLLGSCITVKAANVRVAYMKLICEFVIPNFQRCTNWKTIRYISNGPRLHPSIVQFRALGSSFKHGPHKYSDQYERFRDFTLYVLESRDVKTYTAHSFKKDWPGLADKRITD